MKKSTDELPSIFDNEDKRAEFDVILRRDFPWMFLEMNDAQARFIRVRNGAGRTPKRRLFEAGNKLGKCVTYSTLISTPDGEIPIGKLFENGKPFDVYAWDGEKRVIAHASRPFRKPGTHQCYRIEMSDGRCIEAADDHLILTDLGWKHVSEVYTYWHTLLGSISEPCLPIHASGVVSFVRTPLDYRDCCSGDYRLCGEQLRWSTGIFPTSSPLLVGVQQRDAVLWHEGGQADRCTSISRQGCGLLSRVGNLLRIGGRFFGSLFRDVCTFFLPFLGICREFQQLSTAEGVLFQSDDEFHQSSPVGFRDYGTVTVSFSPPLCVAGNYIISINPIYVKQECYDFSVKKYHNYFAGGLINHNTYIGLAEDIAYSVGYRGWLQCVDANDPDYKIDVKVPNIGLIACETMMHSVAEKIEPMLKMLIPKTCQPVFKPGPTGVLIRVKLPYGPYGEKCGSEIHVRSYDQRPDTFEGIDFDWVHYDEPPPVAIYTAVERGKVVSNASSWLTLTPLKEPWVYDALSCRAAIIS